MKRRKNSKHRYDWKPDLPDFRDHVYSLRPPSVLPKKVDLTSLCSPVANPYAYIEDLGLAEDFWVIRK